MIDQELREKMFQSQYELVHRMGWHNETMLKIGFNAALDIILPLLEQSLEANRFYAKDIEAWGEAEDRSLTVISKDDVETFCMGFFEIHKGGKTARQAIAKIESELKQLGGKDE
jgi:hypothetical protein